MQRIHKYFGFKFGYGAFVYSDAMRYNEIVHELCENSITLTVAQWCNFASHFMHGKNTCIQAISNTHTRLCNSLFHAAHHKRAFTPYKDNVHFNESDSLLRNVQGTVIHLSL